MALSNYTKSASFNALLLGAFAVGTALVLGITYTGTKDLIAESQRIAEEKALLEVIGQTEFDNDLLSDSVRLNDEQTLALNIPSNSQARVIRHQGQVQGLIFSVVAPDGYSGDISLLIGIDLNQNLLGVRVVDHRETPGLGDKVDLKKSDWIIGFEGKSLNRPARENWGVKKDGGEFDAFTGATITPRAVVRAIKSTLEMTEVSMTALVEQAVENYNRSPFSQVNGDTN